MRKYDNYDLTDEQWKEVFDYPKEFKPGDVVENSSAGGTEDGKENVWEVVEESHVLRNGDKVYWLQHLRNCTLGRASSTAIFPIGTFIDDTPWVKDK